MRIAAPLNSEPKPILQWIEVSSSLQIPGFHIIGLPGPEVAEARERVRAAIEACGLHFPKRRLVLNLSPASVRKRGTGLDLAIALAILVSEAKEEGEDFEDLSPAVAWGELGLDGSVKSVSQLTRAVYSTWSAGIPRLMVGQAEYEETRRRLSWIEAAGSLPGNPPDVIAVSNLKEAWLELRSRMPRPAPAQSFTAPLIPAGANERTLLPLPRSVERIVGVSTAGRHHLLLLGPRGSGKSHALEWRSALEPPIHPGLQVRHQLMAELAPTQPEAAVELTPIRRIGSHVKAAALVGHIGNHLIRPGEFTLADGGLLLADEVPEWSRDSREALREPLERQRVGLTRVQGSFELPAAFVFAGTGNLCTCGGWPPEIPVPGQFQPWVKSSGTGLRCQCRPAVRAAYIARLSGPILDRMDLVSLALPIAPEGADGDQAKTRLQALREQVEATRERLLASWGNYPGVMSAAEIQTLLDAHPAWRRQIDETRADSLRSRHKVLRIALTLSAWDGQESPSEGAFAEAACYRAENLGFGRTSPEVA